MCDHSLRDRFHSQSLWVFQPKICQYVSPAGAITMHVSSSPTQRAFRQRPFSSKQSELFSKNLWRSSVQSSFSSSLARYGVSQVAFKLWNNLLLWCVRATVSNSATPDTGSLSRGLETRCEHLLDWNSTRISEGPATAMLHYMIYDKELRWNRALQNVSNLWFVWTCSRPGGLPAPPILPHCPPQMLPLPLSTSIL